MIDVKEPSYNCSIRSYYAKSGIEIDFVVFMQIRKLESVLESIVIEQVIGLSNSTNKKRYLLK